MVCTVNDLQQWKDFPKGLKVLLLEGDAASAAEIKPKLEAMDYNVSAFCDENEALSAISSRSESFHIAIVEVNINSGQGGFKFLENAKDLPTIMTSNDHCLSTMMKCIALGAVEFLHKPLSEEKLRNIWQHVVHKAFNASASVMSESLKPVKESVVSMLQLQTDNEQQESTYTDDDPDPGSDKYPAPSTPQLNQGSRLMDDGDCQEQTNCSTEKESGEHDGEGESKSVETTCGNLNFESNNTNEPMNTEKTLVKNLREDSRDGNHDSSVYKHTNDKVLSSDDGNTKSSNKVDSCTLKAHRKKMKVDWTPELHKKFVKAVEQLGLDQAIPSRILDLMKVEGLTRHNVASHLQKYRMHKRQILPKEEGRKWLNQRDQMQRSYCLQQRPIMAFPPPNHSNHTLSPAPIYPMWRQSGGQAAAMPVWGPPGYPLWHPTESWHWKPLPGLQMHADAWGCPVLPPPQAPLPCFSYPLNVPGMHHTSAVDYKSIMPQSSLDLHLAEEVVDKVVKEAISKPWLPLPLGLKPPSTDSVLAELSRKGISTFPPCSKGS
ncbi:two-component response regulator-like APRR2 isoform X1 [Arachis ipaensis]|uniref:Two-component response regulator-like APRR2 n=2 Tax=Arachis hypogaea TaxID=3818 RepID=A0A445ARL5_ARAHY|nr:two-component response regulator-like APRR2 isoform X1 [Arachis ipaensis]XP_016186765.1 two-component response regulator-like APRR2 isoform X1 [Arachis ipaensis]XP_020975724.1 two-component response regulator-like APRR2 isoform X1 [Arachis ipaensis]XP_025627507.1 two-component response regulator-like APRR2 isoform X1 [Arachis hypogaea]XP_025627508.1 two-component response regulator-like APRR2 isoform X1 [Arachis hypogaea]XP_025627509.1 two-component response regulator-like APRR2 isoform X1 